MNMNVCMYLSGSRVFFLDGGAEDGGRGQLQGVARLVGQVLADDQRNSAAGTHLVQQNLHNITHIHTYQVRFLSRSATQGKKPKRNERNIIMQ